MPGNVWGRSLLGLVQLQLIMAALLFMPPWTLHYREGWIYWAVFGGCALAVSLYFLVRDPAFIERRLKAGPGAESRPRQKVIQAVASFATGAAFALGGLEHRLWPHDLRLWLVLLGDVLVVLGFAIIFRVFLENRHAAATITVESDQKVISTGPYALVRHPMYLGAVVLFAGTPLALASLWSAAASLLLIGVVIARLLDEERYLVKDLPGYAEYRRRVRHRLVPGVW